MGSVRHLLAVLLCVALLSGCSVKLAYNNLERLVRWQVSDYIDMSPAQRELFKREFRKIHDWHRRTHLPQYAAYVRQITPQLSDGADADKMDSMSDQIVVWAEEVEEQTMPLIIDMLAGLSDEQVAALPARLAESNIEWSESETGLSPAEAQAAWAEDFVDTMKTFTGRLNKTQRAYIARRALEYQPERVLWSQYRQRFQTALLELLEQREDPVTFAPAYRALIDRRESFYGEELTVLFEQNENLSQDVAANVLNTLTERQMETLQNNLLDLAEDLEALSLQS